MVCRANLKQYGIVQHMYLDDNDDRYPYSWTSLVKTEHPVGGYERYCRWHDPRYPPDGPLWSYLKAKKINLCPSFKVLAKSIGNEHPNHDPSIPVIPQYSYSMNSWLGSKSGDPGGSSATDSKGRGVFINVPRFQEAKRRCFSSLRKICGGGQAMPMCLMTTPCVRMAVTGLAPYTVDPAQISIKGLSMQSL